MTQVFIHLTKSAEGKIDWGVTMEKSLKQIFRSEIRKIMGKTETGHHNLFIYFYTYLNNMKSNAWWEAPEINIEKIV
jgi:hypothetical protein